MMMPQDFDRAASILAQADGLLITAGAGMGVDSGLPDFRGEKGFWKAYPALGRAGIGFTAIANQQAFEDHPRRAWGFYGHRLKLYRDTVPHAGFQMLLEIGSRMKHGAFVFTSNVDGQFQKAGFAENRIDECHGSIHYLQCLEGCSDNIWPAEGFNPVVDEENCMLKSDLPLCPACGALARPNILMFGDWGWNEQREHAQSRRITLWMAPIRRLAVIEVGAGTSIPSVRMFGEASGGTLIRINPREAHVSLLGDVGLECGGLAGIEAIHQRLLAENTDR
jgi:NAD-dependent SIR2 family protein deacetylase